MNIAEINYHLINLGNKIRNNLEHHNFLFNNVKVSQIHSHQDLSILNNTVEQNGRIKIITNGISKDSLCLKTLRGGIELLSSEGTLNSCSNKILLTSKEFNINNNNIYTLKTKVANIDTHTLLLNGFNNVDIKSDYGKVKLLSNNNDNDSIYISSLKGGIKLFSNSKFEILSSTHINLNCFGTDSEINIGTSSKHNQIINIGNNKSTISINNDVFLKGNIITHDNKIEKITTCLAETSESILLLSKDNVYGSKNTGFISRNVNKYIGFLFDSQKNEFYISDNLQFSRSSGITSNLSFGRLKIGELDINNNVTINKFGTITCKSIMGLNFNFEQTGSLSMSGDLNINDKFKINSKNGNCLLQGQLVIDGININNIYKNNIGNDFKYKTILECLDIIENKKTNTFNSVLYLSPQDYKENIISRNTLINVEGRYAKLHGIINISNQYNGQQNNNVFSYNYSFIRDLEVVANQEQEFIINIESKCNIEYQFNNLTIYVNNHLDKIFNFNIENGTVILNNIVIQSNLDFNLKYCFQISRIKKLIIKNSTLLGDDLLKINDVNSEIIITNCYIDCQKLSGDNLILYNNIIIDTDGSKRILIDKRNRFI